MPLPEKVSGLVKRVPFYKDLRQRYDLDRLRRAIAAANPLNVVIGGGQRLYDGWVFTDKDLLDIANPVSWQKLFVPNSIDRILCEHVLEHLSIAECRVALAQCGLYLRPGGLLRVAVPDSYRRDTAYVAEAAPPNAGHQVFYNVDTFTPILIQAGFDATPLEYFDRDEQFHAEPWDEREGMIVRSARFDTQKEFQRGDLHYTSLIIDARKPHR